MKKEDINNMMIIYSDSDYIRAWSWIGDTLLNTILLDRNICGGKILEDSYDIENFVKSLIPTAIEFIQLREDKYIDHTRYENINKEELNALSEHFKNIRFKYNFSEDDINYKFGGSETVIIDLLENKSYIK